MSRFWVGHQVCSFACCSSVLPYLILSLIVGPPLLSSLVICNIHTLCLMLFIFVVSLELHRSVPIKCHFLVLILHFGTLQIILWVLIFYFGHVENLLDFGDSSELLVCRVAYLLLL